MTIPQDRDPRACAPARPCPPWPNVRALSLDSLNVRWLTGPSSWVLNEIDAFEGPRDTSRRLPGRNYVWPARALRVAANLQNCSPRCQKNFPPASHFTPNQKKLPPSTASAAGALCAGPRTTKDRFGTRMYAGRRGKVFRLQRLGHFSGQVF